MKVYFIASFAQIPLGGNGKVLDLGSFNRPGYATSTLNSRNLPAVLGQYADLCARFPLAQEYLCVFEADNNQIDPDDHRCIVECVPFGTVELGDRKAPHAYDVEFVQFRTIKVHAVNRAQAGAIARKAGLEVRSVNFVG